MAKSLHSHNAAGQVQPLVGKLETQLQLKTQSSRINSKKNKRVLVGRNYQIRKVCASLSMQTMPYRCKKKKKHKKKRRTMSQEPEGIQPHLS